LGAVQNRDYDALNRLVRVSDALNQQTQFQYDANDNLLVQTMPGSAPVNFTYDVLNRQLSREHGSLTSSYEYDAEGNLTKTTDPKGQVFTQQFDQLGRLQQQDFPSGSDLSSVTTSYDGNNNPLSVSETTNRGTELYSYAYDTLDRLTRSEQRGQVLTYQYDNNGNRTQLVSPGGSSDYRYDNRNRLSEVQSGSEISRYHYLANSWLERVENANGSQVAYQYDNAGRVVDIQNSLAGGGLLSSFAYQYDNNGNRTQQVEVQSGFADTQSLTTTYSYDTLDRLTRYTENDGSENKETVYTYFPSYDRKSETVTVGSQTERQRQYTYDNINRLTTITEAAGGEISYLYDRNGNQLSRTDTIDGANDSTLFTYNSRNQLTQVQNGAPGSEASQGQNHYDYRGMRIRQLGSSRGDIEYLYDQKSIVDELQSGSTLAHYTYGDRLLSLNHSGESQFYHYAALGTTANLSDSAGQVKVSYRSDVFGSITKQEGTSVNRQVFTGQEHDENTGLIYFGARFYDPAIGRFMTQDTYLGESNTPPSLHRYLYAYSNPTYYFDPNGHAAVAAPLAETAIVAAENVAVTGAIALATGVDNSVDIEPLDDLPPTLRTVAKLMVVQQVVSSALENMASDVWSTITTENDAGPLSTADTEGKARVDLGRNEGFPALTEQLPTNTGGKQIEEGNIRDSILSSPNVGPREGYDTGGQHTVETGPINMYRDEDGVNEKDGFNSEADVTNTVTGFHGTKAKNIESIRNDGAMNPNSEGEIFLSGNQSDTFVHGADSSIGGALSAKVTIDVGKANSVTNISVPGNPNAILIKTDTPLSTTVDSVTIRKPDGDGGFEYEDQ
ncbi:RHS repeat-associated core domain-containing protein, partial [Pseudoteredinibacter isoporae]